MQFLEHDDLKDKTKPYREVLSIRIHRISDHSQYKILSVISNQAAEWCVYKVARYFRVRLKQLATPNKNKEYLALFKDCVCSRQMEAHGGKKMGSLYTHHTNKRGTADVPASLTFPGTNDL